MELLALFTFVTLYIDEPYIMTCIMKDEVH
jgi:hypothetical protein